MGPDTSWFGQARRQAALAFDARARLPRSRPAVVTHLSQCRGCLSRIVIELHRIQPSSAPPVLARATPPGIRRSTESTAAVALRGGARQTSGTRRRLSRFAGRLALVLARVSRRPREPRCPPLGAGLPQSGHEAVPDQHCHSVRSFVTVRHVSLRQALVHEATRSAIGATEVAGASTLAGRVAMCFATRAASLPAPPMSMDVNECRKSSPTK